MIYARFLDCLKNGYIAIAITAAFLLTPFMIIAQYTISGKVIDGANEPIIGASITEDGTTNGTITDLDGLFSFQVSSPQSVLILQYIGMNNVSFPINNQNNVIISMSEDSKVLDEIVVVGYGNQKKSSISGSVSVVTAEEIKATPVLRVEQALQGRTAGVQIAQNSGSPGSALTVRIRGTGTITNSDPLYVVDGIIVEGMDFLNPNDIENISVLKDAAASAVYGARAANGVVLITTKSKSRKKEGSISYDAYFGSQSVGRTLDLLTAKEYATLSNEAYINSGLVPLTNLQNPAQFNKGTNWQSAIFEQAPIQSHSINMNSSSEKGLIGLSGGYFLQDGIVGGSKARFKRYTARAIFEQDIKSWLNIGSNIGFTQFKRNTLQENNEFTSPIIQAINMDPLTPVYKPDGTFAYSDFVDTDIRNPANAIQNTHNLYNSNRVVGSVFGQLKATDHLSFKSTYSVDATFAQGRGFNPRYNLSVDSTDAPVTERNLINSVSISNNTWKNWQWENLATYSKDFGIHRVNAIGGISANAGRAEFNGGANTNLPTNDPKDALISNTIDPISSQSVYEVAEEFAFFSYISKVDYAYDDKYLATLSFRADGSSKFGRNNRFGYFPSMSLGWNIHKETFFSSDAVSALKLRASWGRNGNDRIGNYGFTSTVLNGQNYTLGPDQIITNGAIALTVANPDLRWETVTQTNFGVDAEFWQGKLLAVFDYYIKNTKDMLYNAPIPAVVGAAAPTRNIGEVQNSGIEGLLQYRSKIGKIEYDLGVNASFLQNKVQFLGGGDPTFSGNTFVHGPVSKTDIGQPIASFFGYVTDGLFQTSQEVEDHAFQATGTAPGDIRFKDLDENGVIDENDKTFIGNPSPDAIFGFNHAIRYRNFDISGFWQGVYGNDIFNASVRYDKIGANRPASIINRWTGPGTSNSEPRLGIQDPNNNARASDRFIEDGSYLRLKNIQIGYTVSPTMAQRWHIGKLRLYLSGQNLLTLTNYNGYDPEIGTRGPLEIGIDRGFYPSSRMVLGGINLTF